jgi:hypothetical protein
MQKVDYKSQKIPVAVTPALKLQIEQDAVLLGISPPALLRLLYHQYVKNGRTLRADQI